MKKENYYLTSTPKPETDSVIRSAQNSLMAMVILGPWRNFVTLIYTKFVGRSNPNADKSKAKEAEIAAQIREKGFSIGMKFPDVLINEVRKFALNNNQKTYVNPHLISDSIADIVNHEKVLQVVEQYLGVRKVCCNSRLWANKPEDRENTDSQRERLKFGTNTPFHYDLSDFQSLTLFVYISDVDDTSGHHDIVEGSHRDKSLKKYWNRFISEQEVQEKFPGKLIKIVGSAGTSFFEDITCYHRRSHHDMSKDRLMLSAQYNLIRKPATE